MEDKSFTNLFKDESINKIDIDPRLIPSFKRVMIKIQKHFNASGYTTQKDYEEFFNKYLLTGEQSEKLQIQVNNEPSKYGANGFYEQHNLHGRNRLVIDEMYLDDESILDHIFIHEFIHFLVMRGLDKSKLKENVKNKKFVNEALTEMLTQQIDNKKFNSYQPQVEMMKFANNLSGNVNNYQRFLSGNLDPISYGSSWVNFLNDTTIYHNKKSKENDFSFEMSDAIKDSDYINAQRNLIHSYISTHQVNDLDTYLEKVRIIETRPVDDIEFTNEFYNRMDDSFLVNLGITEPKLKELMNKNLLQLRKTINELNMYNNKDVYEFEFNGHTIVLDKEILNYTNGSFKDIVYSDNPLFGVSIELNKKEGILNLRNTQGKNNELKLNINELDFDKRRKDLIKEKERLSEYFVPSLKKDIQIVNDVSLSKDNLIKLEKFTLPRIGFDKKSPQVVYVAHYENGLQVLDTLNLIGTVSDINMAKYVGVTAKENGLVVYDDLGVISKGYKFSTLTEKVIKNRVISLLQSKIKMTQEMLTSYQQSPEYQSEEDLEDLKENARYYLANQNYENLTLEEKKRVENKVISQGEQFIISGINEDLDVSLLFGEKICFKGKKDTLVDTKGTGLYNSIYQDLSKDKTSSDLPREVINEQIDKNADKSQVLAKKIDLLKTKRDLELQRQQKLNLEEIEHDMSL